MTHSNPFYNLKLDPEEEQIEQDLEAGLFKPVPNMKKELKRIQQYARYTLSKAKNINVRITERDLLELKRIADLEGMPYQTLVGSILHKFILKESSPKYKASLKSVK